MSSDQSHSGTSESPDGASRRPEIENVDCETCIQDIYGLWDAISYLSTKDLELIERALNYAGMAHRGQMRDSGHHYLTHVIAVARLTVEWDRKSADVDVIAAGVLHDCVEDSPIKVDELEKMFGKTVAYLVDGCTKIQLIDNRQTKDNLAVLKSFKYSLGDPRVLVIKLMDRYHNVSTLGSTDEEKQSRKAEETVRIFVPLAEALGMNEFARALETLCFKVIDREAYEAACYILKLSRSERGR